MTLYDFPDKKRPLPARFVQGKTKLNFKVDGQIGTIMIEYKYYPSKDSISYIDVSYTDKRLQSMIESDPEMIRRIDSYIRRLHQNNRSNGGSAG
jgi:hypothetical protein